MALIFIRYVWNINVLGDAIACNAKSDVLSVSD